MASRVARDQLGKWTARAWTFIAAMVVIAIAAYSLGLAISGLRFVAHVLS